MAVPRETLAGHVSAEIELPRLIRHFSGGTSASVAVTSVSLKHISHHTSAPGRSRSHCCMVGRNVRITGKRGTYRVVTMSYSKSHLTSIPLKDKIPKCPISFCFGHNYPCAHSPWSKGGLDIAPPPPKKKELDLENSDIISRYTCTCVLNRSVSVKEPQV